MDKNLPTNPEITPQNLPIKKGILNQKGNFLIPIGVIIVIFILIAGYYFVNSKINNQPNLSKNNQTSNSNLNSTETNGWNIYTNKNYGFTLKHPNLSLDGSICGQKPVSNADFELLSLTSISVDTPNSCDSFNYFLVFHVNSKDATIDQEIQAIKDSLGFKDNDVVITEETLGNNKVKKMLLLTDLPTEPKTQARNFWFVRNNEYYFFYDPKLKSVYTVYAHFEDPKYKGDIEKIISTVTFDSSLAKVDIKTPFYQYFPKEAYTRQDFTKRNYDKSIQSDYITKEYYTPLDKLSDDNLVDFKCSYDIYVDPKDMNYHYSVPNKPGDTNQPKSFEVPIGAQLYRTLTNDPRMGFRGFKYCQTSDNREYILATVSGGPLELVQLNGDKAEIMVKDPKITGWYSSCSNILAITKDNNFYIGCGGGDTTITTWINKVDANTGVIKEVVSCLTPHPETGRPTECKSY